MSDKRVLAAFLAATIVVAGGSAWAASEAGQSPSPAAQRDFGKLSADGAHGFQDLSLARLAIYDGKTDQAKKFVGMAETSFMKAKSDDSVFMKDEHDLMTADQAAAKGKKMPATATSASADSKPAEASGAKAAGPIAWLPVDGAISLNEDYTMNPTKAKAVADANKSLAKGDRKGAVDQLKLASVDTSVVLEVVPLDQTITDVQKAAQMINDGKYYEGSQVLRQVQMAARYDVTDIIGTPTPAPAANSGQTKTDMPAKPAPATH